jgi:Pyridoxamine 5'-phosphate oxidase
LHSGGADLPMLGGMSIPVEIPKLAEALADFGAGYLLTAAADGRVKAVTVEPTLVDGVLRCPTSRGSARNLAANPAATLVFWPRQDHGYSLLVDGTAVADDEAIAFTPETAVLHRPADHADGPVAGDGCGHDCAPVA